jgi:hypothetical protein
MLLSSETITPNANENVVIQPDDNTKENVVIQPDDNAKCSGESYHSIKIHRQYFHIAK